MSLVKQTGTGKAAAFGLPTLNKIDTANNNVQALVIAQRELAVQSQEELFRFGRDKGVKVRSVYGGSSIEKQIRPFVLVPMWLSEPQAAY